MEKEFVTYEIGLELKNLGFNERCYGCFSHLDNRELRTSRVYTNGVSENIAAPIFSQAFRWFREKYGLFTSILVDRTTKPKFCYNMSEYFEDETTWEWKDDWGNSSFYRNYEEAELACLKKLIEIVKNK